MTNTARATELATELATIVTGIRACETRQAIGLIYEGMVGYNLADDDTEASLEDLRGTALDYVRELCAAEGIHCADVGLFRDLSDWTIIDNRADKSVEPAAPFTDAQWIDKSADDYRADTLDGERSIDDSDIHIHIYEQTLNAYVAYVARGTGVREITLTDEPMAWRDLLADWDTSVLDEADEDFEGECKVWIEFNFFAGTLGDTRDRYYSDPEIGDNSPTVFGSFYDAKAWVDEQEDSPYYLGNGEAGRPSYTICKA